MKSAVLFKTKSKALYFHSGKANQFLLNHPVFHYLLDLHNQGIDIKEWFENLKTDTIEIENYGDFTREEVKHYIHKYLLLSGNGYLEAVDTKKSLSRRLRPIDVKSNLANCKQVALEVTDQCNLKCKYCGYGEFYCNYDKRDAGVLSVKVAKNILNYLLELWNSPLNRSHKTEIDISFYGGEPLLNFPFIEEIFTHLSSATLIRNRFGFGITTNGVLLDKYMDFLVKNDFRTVISLDGDEKNSDFRVFHSGKSSFKKVYENVSLLRYKYPDYFEKKVSFNSVLHSKNSVSDIHKFFKTEFDKIPSILEVSAMGINPEKKKEFWKTYKNFRENIRQLEDYSMIEKDMLTSMPDPREALGALQQYSGFIHKTYDVLVSPERYRCFIPTATCIPFSRKIFVTANGKLLPCERIGFNFYLGYAGEEKVNIDFEQIAEKYNKYYDKLHKQCTGCYNAKSCSQCIFYLDIEGDNPVCRGFMNREEFSNYLSTQLSCLENNHELYTRGMKEVVMI